MNRSDINDFFNRKPEILYPFNAFEACKEMPVGMNFGTTCKINNLNIPAIMIKCNQESLDDFGINFPPPQPALQFRMLDLAKEDFVIEIVLHFDNSSKLRLHLNPNNKLIHHFLNRLRITSIISFHFYSENNNSFVSSITSIGQEEIEWINRNRKLSLNLKPDNNSRMITELLIKRLNVSTDKIYKFKEIEDEKCMSEFSSRFVSMTVK